MDKFTQAMVQHKAGVIKSGMSKNVDGIFGGKSEKEQEDDEITHNNATIRAMKEQREKEKNKRDEIHQKKFENREKVRNDIRDKYKLKGSKLYDGQYDRRVKETDLAFASNSHHIKAKKEDSCCIQ